MSMSWGLIPPKKLQALSNWNMKHYKSVEILSIFRMESSSVEDFLVTVLSGPFIETFIRTFRVISSIRFCCLVLTWHTGTEFKILYLARLWQEEWTAQCSNIGCLVNHTSLAWALLNIRDNVITQMFRDKLNKLCYCHRISMVVVAKPSLWPMWSNKVCKEAIFRLAISSFKAQ